MRLKPEVRVGVIVFLAFVAAVAAYMFLGGLGWRAQTYRVYAIFENVQTLQKGSDVRMAGVRVGVVQDIQLVRGNKARVVMFIFDRYKVPEDSIARISTAGVIGEYYMEIVPGSSDTYVEPGATLKSEEVATLNNLLAQASGLMKDVSSLTNELKGTATGLNKIIGDEETVASFKNTVRNLELASANGVTLTDQLNRTVSGVSPQIERILGDVSIASGRLGVISEDLALTIRGARTGLIEGGGYVKIQQVLQNAQLASENLARASESLVAFAEDKQLQEDIKCAAAQARRAATSAAELAERLNRFGRRDRTPETPEQTRTRRQLSGLNLDQYINLGANKFRTDINYTYIPYGSENLYRLGVRDVGENTKLNLQIGKVGKDSAFRYGLYASTLGIGYDRSLGDRFLFTSDLYDPNDVMLEVKGLYRLNPNWGIWLGMDGLLEDPGMLIGAQYRK